MRILLLSLLTAFTVIDGQIVQYDLDTGQAYEVDGLLPSQEGGDFFIDQSHVSDSEVSAPEVSDPEVLDPEVSAPEVSDPDVLDPEVSSPEDSYFSGASAPQVFNIVMPDTPVSFPEDYATADQMDDLIMLLANTSSVNQYLSTNLITYMRDILQGYSNYKYVAYRSDLSDANSGYLIIGKKCSASGDWVFSGDVSVCRFYRTYSGNTYYYNYNVSHPASYSVGVGSNVLLYTNVLDGYPRLESDAKSYDLWLFGALAVGIILILLNFGRRK